MPGINDESDLGYYYAHEAGIYSEKDLGPLANYIDYERYGRDIAMDEQGRFTDEGYVRAVSYTHLVSCQPAHCGKAVLPFELP